MRLSRLLAVGVFVVPGVLAGVIHNASAKPVGDESGIRRIRAHFDSVLTELIARDTKNLTSDQRSRRAELVRTLSAYRERGVFPHNYDFPGRAVPYFVDRKTGTLCAVAHLLASTGRRDIVDRVAAVDNNVWVAELAGDTAFGSWLRDNGLTLAEAARIQVPYVRQTSLNEPSVIMTILATPFVFGATTVTGLWNANGNRDGHRRVVSAIGVTSGALATAAGGYLLSKGDLPGIITAGGAVMAATGILTVGYSSRSISHHRAIIAAEREAAARKSIAEATLVPILPTSTSGPGLGLSLRF